MCCSITSLFFLSWDKRHSHIRGLATRQRSTVVVSLVSLTSYQIQVNHNKQGLKRHCVRYNNPTTTQTTVDQSKLILFKWAPHEWCQRGRPSYIPLWLLDSLAEWPLLSKHHVPFIEDSGHRTRKKERNTDGGREIKVQYMDTKIRRS